jgi:death-on-curing family protein
MKKQNNQKKQAVIYQTKTGAIELSGDVTNETIWATQAQIVKLFNVDQSVISRHINNIFKDGEVISKGNMQKMHIAKSDKPVMVYSLDIILSVGYRTNSKIAIEFRKWATKTLRSYITTGFAINKNRIVKNYQQFLTAVEDVKHFLPANKSIDAGSVLELISLFADTWFSLSAYDNDFPAVKGVTKKKVNLTADMLSLSLVQLKSALIKKQEATELFGLEKNLNSISGIVGNIMQTFDGRDLYHSIEEKAAHLLYFMVKNHPFVDGNKRSGAYAFIWFLRQTKVLDVNKMTPVALTALTLLVAESNPKEKDRIIRLILMLLNKKSVII